MREKKKRGDCAISPVQINYVERERGRRLGSAGRPSGYSIELGGEREREREAYDSFIRH